MGSNGENMVMPVSPMLGGNSGFGGWGDNGAWWLLILLFALGGWGNGNGGFGGGFANDAMWPYFFNNQTQNDVNRGFDNAGISNQLTSIQSSITSGFGDTALGIAGINQNICQTGNNITSAVSNGFAQSEISANARQMANMNQIFGLSQQFADCCCENRLATCQTQNTIQNEGSATRFADANNTRDIIENANRNNQAVLDKLCQLEIDAKNDKISDLERQLTMANLSASQTAQTAEIQRGQVAEVDALYNRLSTCPVPSMPVYGSQPIFTCPQNSGCGCNTGCGCGNF